MTKLFLLKPDFTDSKIDAKGQCYYCPHCALIEGVLSFYPHLRDKIAIEYVDFQRPRPAIVNLIGENNQGCPVLIISKIEADKTDKSAFKQNEDYFFANSTDVIMQYLADRFGIGMPHP